MKSMATWPRISVSLEREEIPVAGMSPSRVPDEKWKFVDKEGHGHFWQGKDLPTLFEVVTGYQWVGDEYDGEEYPITEMRCRQCKEVVEPGYRLEHGPAHVPGPTTVTLQIDNEIYTLTPDEFAESVDEWKKALDRACR